MTIANNLPTVPNVFALRCDAIVALLKERTSIKDVDLGVRPLSLGPTPSKVDMPSIFVQPDEWPEDLNTNVKYDYWGTVYLFCAVTGQSYAAATRAQLELLAVLGKLFSNNALNDRITGTPSNKYYVYPGNWIESRFKGQILRVIPWQKERSSLYLGRVICTFRFHDVLVH